MVSAYLEYPIRTLKQALADRARARRKSLSRGPEMPPGPAVGRYDPSGLMIRLLAKDHGTAADRSTPAGGRRVA